MPAIDSSAVRRAFAEADKRSGHAKGQVLERLIIDIFATVPGLRLMSHDVLNAAGSHEIDLAYYNVRRPDGLADFGPELMVECKNLSRPVDSMQVGWFVQKLERANQKSGILVATHGITGNIDRGDRALDLVDFARARNVCVVVLTRIELETIPSVEHLCRLLQKKLFHVKIHGTVYQMNASDLQDATHHSPVLVLSDQQSGGSAPVIHGGVSPGNASRLATEELVRTFIPIAEFSRLLAYGNSLLVGPRGSGKTAVLRILEKASLDLWTHPETDLLPGRRDYRGVYVSLGGLGMLNFVFKPPYGTEMLACMSIITVHVLMRVVEAFRQDMGLLPEPDRTENRLCGELSSLWQLDIETLNFQGVQLALHGRQLRLAQAVRRSIDPTSHPSPGQIVNPSDEMSDLRLNVSAAIRAFKAIEASSPGDLTWCLLIDDVDAVGQDLGTEILNCFRETGMDLLMKVACSPFMKEGLGGRLVVAPGHDYDLVTLPSGGSSRFAEQLAREELIRRGIVESLETVFGSSALSGSSSWDRHSFQESRSLARLSASQLAEKDEIFRAWTETVDLFASPDSSVLRKIATLVAFRNEFLSSREGRLLFRTRKGSTLWTGLPDVLSVLDGLPRTVILFLDEVLSGHSGRVSSTSQAAGLRRISDRFAQFLDGMPVASPDETVLVIMDKIGVALAQRFYGPFHPDPYLTIIDDSAVGSNLNIAISEAIQVGAAFVVSTSYDRRSAPRRFRLAGLLAMRHRLPTRLGRAIPLSKLLAPPNGSDRRSIPDSGKSGKVRLY